MIGYDEQKLLTKYFLKVNKYGKYKIKVKKKKKLIKMKIKTKRG